MKHTLKTPHGPGVMENLAAIQHIREITASVQGVRVRVDDILRHMHFPREAEYIAQTEAILVATCALVADCARGDSRFIPENFLANGFTFPALQVDLTMVGNAVSAMNVVKEANRDNAVLRAIWDPGSEVTEERTALWVEGMREQHIAVLNDLYADLVNTLNILRYGDSGTEGGPEE